VKAGASAFSVPVCAPGNPNRWHRAAIARRAYRALFASIYPLLHRNNYKIKVDQFKSSIKLNNSFNF